MKLQLSLVSLLVISIISCKKTNPVKFDPCSNQPTIADFRIDERVADTFLPSSTVLVSSAAKFTASEKYDSVKWIIGKDDRTFSTRSVTLIFDVPEQVDVTLIGFISSNFQCNGRIIDTVTKQLLVVDVRQSRLVGSFRGVFTSNPTDTFTFQINQTNDVAWYNDYFIYNFPNNCTIPSPPYPENVGYLISAGAHNFRIRNDLPAVQQCLFNIDATGRLLTNDSLYVDFTFRSSASSPSLTQNKFHGIKL